MYKRSIIVHFHFFKNAGTSVETILGKQFGKRFMAYEPGGAAETHRAEALIPVLEQNESVQAVSSHTICFPPPSRPDWQVYSIVFIRHPLDRILSMYNFENKQKSKSPGAIIAKQHGAAGYVRARLESPHERTLRNYQASMLAPSAVASPRNDYLLMAASSVVRELPVIGVVDQFNESIKQLQAWLAPNFTGLSMRPVHRQRGGPAGMSLDDRVQYLKSEIGEELFLRLEEENSVDLALYRLACQKLDSSRGRV